MIGYLFSCMIIISMGLAVMAISILLVSLVIWAFFLIIQEIEDIFQGSDNKDDDDDCYFEI